MAQESITSREISERFGIPLSTVVTTATKSSFTRTKASTYLINDSLLNWLDNYKPQGGKKLLPQQERELRHFVARHKQYARLKQQPPNGSITLGELAEKDEGDGSNYQPPYVAKEKPEPRDTPSIEPAPTPPPITDSAYPKEEQAVSDVGELLMDGLADLQKRVTAIEAMELRGNLDGLAMEINRLGEGMRTLNARVDALAAGTPASSEGRWAVLRQIVSALDAIDMEPAAKEAVIAQLLKS